jgi:hypothetical protein
MAALGATAAGAPVLSPPDKAGARLRPASASLTTIWAAISLSLAEAYSPSARLPIATYHDMKQVRTSQTTTKTLIRLSHMRNVSALVLRSGKAISASELRQWVSSMSGPGRRSSAVGRLSSSFCVTIKVNAIVIPLAGLARRLR